MIYIYRFIWIVGYCLLLVLEFLLLFVMILIYPLIGIFYFIKNGDVESTPFLPVTPSMWMDKEYLKLLKKLNKSDENGTIY
jgi:hypothetical protein